MTLRLTDGDLAKLRQAIGSPTHGEWIISEKVEERFCFLLEVRCLIIKTKRCFLFLARVRCLSVHNTFQLIDFEKNSKKRNMCSSIINQINENERQNRSLSILYRSNRITSSSSLIELGNLDRILHLAGQNLPHITVDHVRRQAEELYRIDEIFLEDLEPLLVPVWEDFTNEEIHQILIEAFETFDINRQGSISRQDLMEMLSQYGDMPLTNEDFQLMFSLVESSNNFDYRQFVQKISGLNNEGSVKKKKKKKKKKKNSSKRSSR